MYTDCETDSQIFRNVSYPFSYDDEKKIKNEEKVNIYTMMKKKIKNRKDKYATITKSW